MKKQLIAFLLILATATIALASSPFPGSFIRNPYTNLLDYTDGFSTLPTATNSVIWSSGTGTWKATSTPTILSLTTVSNIQIGTQATYVGSPTPLYIDLGNTYSGTPGTGAKLRLGNDGAGDIYGLGVSAGQLDSIVPNGSAFAWYINGVQKLKLDATALTVAGDFTAPNASPTLAGLTVTGQSILAQSSGVVGVGVTPSAWSTFKAIELGSVGNGIAGALATVELFSSAYYSSGWKYGDSSYSPTRIEMSNGAISMYTISPGTLGSSISWDNFFSYSRTTDIVSIPKSVNTGTLTIGTATANNGTYLFVAGYNQTQISLNGASSYYGGIGSPSGNTWALGWSTAVGSALTSVLTWNSAGAVSMPAYGNGTMSFTGGNGTITSSSDERLKDIKGPFTRGLKEIGGISPIIYDWNEKSGYPMGNTYAGFSAQNVMKTIPEAVSTDSRGYYSLNDRAILAAAVNAINDLRKENEDLRREVKELKDMFPVAKGWNPHMLEVTTSPLKWSYTEN